jgi:hypothetical protein
MQAYLVTPVQEHQIPITLMVWVQIHVRPLICILSHPTYNVVVHTVQEMDMTQAATVHPAQSCPYTMQKPPASVLNHLLQPVELYLMV